MPIHTVKKSTIKIENRKWKCVHYKEKQFIEEIILEKGRNNGLESFLSISKCHFSECTYEIIIQFDQVFE